VRPRPDRRSVDVQPFVTCEPLELELLASHLTSLGHEVEILDLRVDRRSVREILRRGSYGLVGFTGYVNHVHVVRRLALEVKRVSRTIRVVVGGVHAEVSPGDYLDENIDHVLWADGILTLGEIATGLSPAEAAVLPGVWGSGKARPVAHPLPTLRPDRTATAAYRGSYTDLRGERCASLQTASGCPHGDRACTCPDTVFVERPLDDVVAELDEIDAPHVLLVDNDLFATPWRVDALCDALDRRGAWPTFVAFSSVESITENPTAVRRMRGHGLEAVYLQVQASADGPSGDATTAQLRSALAVLTEARVACFAWCVTGPDWDARATDDLLKVVDGVDPLDILVVTPMPVLEPTGPQPTGKRAAARIDWDMGRLSFRPTSVSVRGYYWQLLRLQAVTLLSPSRRRRIAERYGAEAGDRALRRGLKVCLRYVSLVIWPR